MARARPSALTTQGMSILFASWLELSVGQVPVHLVCCKSTMEDHLWASVRKACSNFARERGQHLVRFQSSELFRSGHSRDQVLREEFQEDALFNPKILFHPRNIIPNLQI